jgi:hypothetical protein
VAEIYRSWSIELTAVDGPSEIRDERTFEWDSREITEGMAPTVYVFSKNEIPYIRNNRAVEVTFRASFDPDPEWLDDATWYGNEDIRVEVNDGLCLESREM